MRTLMGLSLLAVGLFSFSLTGCGDPSEAGCRIDGDCRPGRACVERLCVDKVIDGVDSGVTNNGSTNPDGGSVNPDGGGSNLDMGGLDMDGPTPDMGMDPDMGGPTPDMGTDPDMGGPNPDMGTPVFGPSMVVVPTSIDFGFVPTNSSIDATIRIANVGDGDLNLSNVGLQSTPSQAFSVSAPATTVAPGETLDVVVTFAPTQGARFANAVTISGDDANNPDALVELLGRGFGTTFQSCMFTSPSQLDFGPVAPGATATAEVTVGNCTQTATSPSAPPPSSTAGPTSR